MNLQNGYKAVYEKAADGERTFYASKCDGSDDTEIASFVDVDYRNRTIYEYEDGFYVSAVGQPPAYGTDGVPSDERLSEFDVIFVKAEASEPVTTELDTPSEPDNANPEAATPEDE